MGMDANNNVTTATVRLDHGKDKGAQDAPKEGSSSSSNRRVSSVLLFLSLRLHLERNGGLARESGRAIGGVLVADDEGVGTNVPDGAGNRPAGLIAGGGDGGVDGGDTRWAHGPRGASLAGADGGSGAAGAPASGRCPFAAVGLPAGRPFPFVVAVTPVFAFPAHRCYADGGQ